MFSIMRTLKEFCQWRVLSFCSVFSFLKSVKQAAVGCVCGIMFSWYIYIYCKTSSLFSLFLFIFASLQSDLPTNQICSMWCSVFHEWKMLLFWKCALFLPKLVTVLFALTETPIGKKDLCLFDLMIFAISWYSISPKSFTNCCLCHKTKTHSAFIVFLP